MKDYLTIGSSPTGEDCAQVGTDDYYEKAHEECKHFINLLIKTFGKEPPGTKLAIRSFEHDFGTYYEVVCYFDDNFPESVDYAFECEGKTPEYWEKEN